MPYFFRKLGKMSHNLSSPAVVIDALRVKTKRLFISLYIYMSLSLNNSLKYCEENNQHKRDLGTFMHIVYA